MQKKFLKLAQYVDINRSFNRVIQNRIYGCDNEVINADVSVIFTKLEILIHFLVKIFCRSRGIPVL